MTNRFVQFSLPLDLNGVSTLANVVMAMAAIAAIIATVVGLWFGLKQLTTLNKQLKFDATMKIYDFSRELHTLIFSNPKLWSLHDRDPETLNQDEREMLKRHIQMFFNMRLLDWKARELGYLDDEQWDAVEADYRFLGKPADSAFWRNCKHAYPKGFRIWIEEQMRKVEKQDLLERPTSPTKEVAA